MATASKSGVRKGSETQEDLNVLEEEKGDEATCGTCGKMVMNKDKGI